MANTSLNNIRERKQRNNEALQQKVIKNFPYMVSNQRTLHKIDKQESSKNLGMVSKIRHKIINKNAIAYVTISWTEHKSKFIHS